MRRVLSQVQMGPTRRDTAGATWDKPGVRVYPSAAGTVPGGAVDFPERTLYILYNDAV